MATKIAQQETASTKLIGRWEQVCQKLAALAEEIPANKFGYKPLDGVRTVAEILRHAAFWNLYVADAVRGKKGNDSDNELSAQQFATKKQIIDVFTSSASDVAKALSEASGELRPETVETLVAFIEHNCEHYGQLAVYARMNKIVPPASRG
ncbi:MAG TPA: DinB family protein [Candidatus Acidoferrales bacterium]|nr:DinB family protein [Candidatus Acidoferrales bacterium]